MRSCEDSMKNKYKLMWNHLKEALKLSINAFKIIPFANNSLTLKAAENIYESMNKIERKYL